MNSQGIPKGEQMISLFHSGTAFEEGTRKSATGSSTIYPIDRP